MASIQVRSQNKCDKLLHRWLQSRQHLIVSYTKLAEQVRHNSPVQITPGLDEFASEMVDYLSEGHFEVYEHLQSPEITSNNKKPQLLAKIYQTTEIAMTFHDKYLLDCQVSHNEPCFERDFSTLGEALTIRFELEDKMATGL